MVACEITLATIPTLKDSSEDSEHRRSRVVHLAAKTGRDLQEVEAIFPHVKRCDVKAERFAHILPPTASTLEIPLDAIDVFDAAHTVTFKRTARALRSTSQFHNTTAGGRSIKAIQGGRT